MSEEQSLTLERVFDAPKEAVWIAWTKPEHWAAWFGKPGNVPAESVEMNVEVGGKWKSTTEFNGERVDFSGVYQEVNPPNKLVMTFGDPNNSDTETVTVLFEDVAGGTKMIFKQEGHLPPEEYQIGLTKAWTGFFDHLERHLPTMQET